MQPGAGLYATSRLSKESGLKSLAGRSFGVQRQAKELAQHAQSGKENHKLSPILKQLCPESLATDQLNAKQDAIAGWRS